MARVTNVMLDGRAYGKNTIAPALDLTYGGQMGWSPNLFELISNQAYVRKNLICILLRPPAFFQLMPEPQKWVDSLRSILELHSRSIEGYNAGLTVELDEHSVGGGGEFQQEVIDVKRARSEPVYTFVEKYGMPIQTFLMNWIQYGLMDPDAKYAMVSTLTGAVPQDLLHDWYSCSVLVMEPDPLHRRVLKSWVTTNMFPKGTGDIIGKRDLTTASELTTLSVEFTGVSQYGLGTNVFAQRILDRINIQNANPYLRPSFIQQIDPSVDTGVTGYEVGTELLGANAILA